MCESERSDRCITEWSVLYVYVKDLSLQECTRYIPKIGLHLHGFVLLWHMISSIFCSLNLSLDLQVYGTKF